MPSCYYYYLDCIKKGRMEDSERKESNEIQRYCLAKLLLLLPRLYQVRTDGRFGKERIKRNPKILPWPSCILLLRTTRILSRKDGWKIRKGKNQTKSKDIAVAKLHTTTSYLIDSITIGRMEDLEMK
jgi:hypothetical protein